MAERNQGSGSRSGEGWGGPIARTLDAANRRFQVVTLIEAGEPAFLRMREAAIAFDAQLGTGLAEADLAALAHPPRPPSRQRRPRSPR